jgi:hypothetical protein
MVQRAAPDEGLRRFLGLKHSPYPSEWSSKDYEAKDRLIARLENDKASGVKSNNGGLFSAASMALRSSSSNIGGAEVSMHKNTPEKTVKTPETAPAVAQLSHRSKPSSIGKATYYHSRFQLMFKQQIVLR